MSRAFHVVQRRGRPALLVVGLLGSGMTVAGPRPVAAVWPALVVGSGLVLAWLVKRDLDRISSPPTTPVTSSPAEPSDADAQGNALLRRIEAMKDEELASAGRRR